jgi:hypothetical protein
MKMEAIKQEVYSVTCTKNTKQLKKEHPDLTGGRDLRYKAQWLEILEKLKALSAQGSDMSLADLQQSEQMLKESLIAVGRISGLSDNEIEVDWQRIKLEAQFEDVHIEEL